MPTVKKKIDRHKAKLMYVSSELSYDDIRKHFNVSKGFIARIAKEDGWIVAREKHRSIAINRAVEKSAEMEGDKLAEASSQLSSIRRHLFEGIELQMKNGELNCDIDTYLKVLKMEKELEAQLNPQDLTEITLLKDPENYTIEELKQMLENNGSLIEIEHEEVPEDVENTAERMIKEYGNENIKEKP